MKKVFIEKEEIIKKIGNIDFENFDLIIAIERGGIFPAQIISKKYNKPLKSIKISFRDDNHKPMYEEPKVINKIDFEYKGKKILLVDDILRTGKTIKAAKNLLKGANVKIFVINGIADYNLYNIKDCIILI